MRVNCSVRERAAGTPHLARPPCSHGAGRAFGHWPDWQFHRWQLRRFRILLLGLAERNCVRERNPRWVDRFELPWEPRRITIASFRYSDVGSYPSLTDLPGRAWQHLRRSSCGTASSPGIWASPISTASIHRCPPVACGIRRGSRRMALFWPSRIPKTTAS